MTHELLLRGQSESGPGIELSMTIEKQMQKQQVEMKGISMEIDITLKDEKGNIVNQVKAPGNSFLLNFMRMLYAVLRATSYGAFACERVKTTESYTIEGQTTQYSRELAGIQAWAIKEDDSHGIVIGTGTKTVAPDDAWLDSQIKNGFSSGQMLYLASDVSNTEIVGSDAHIYLKRSFINHSGSDITVTESGVAVWNVSPSSYQLIIRDLIPPVNVPNDYTLDVQYTISVLI